MYNTNIFSIIKKIDDFRKKTITNLKNVKNEKYGRVLADVYLGDLHVNQWLLDNKYAVQYSGGTKTNWV